MRILFIDNNPVLMDLLPKGFEADHRVMVIHDILLMESVIKSFRPDLIITQGWASLTDNPQYQRYIGIVSKKFRVPLIYWSVEDPIWTETFVLPLLERMQPSFVFTICKSKVNYFQRKGFKCSYLDFGYQPRISQEMPRKEIYEIAIVANSYHDMEAYYPYRIHTLKVLLFPLIENNIRVDFWGEGWNSFLKKHLGKEIPQEWLHEPLPYSEVFKIYNSTKIIISPQNLPKQVTLRTYDILGSGGFLLTIDTPGVRSLFQPGEELVVSSTPEETIHLVQYYLKKPDERIKISQQGKMSVLNHSYTHRANYMIEVLKQNHILK